MSTVLDPVAESPVVVPAPLPDFFEVVNGEIVEPPPMSDYALDIANLLNRTLGRYLDHQDLGVAAVEYLFRIPLPEDRDRIRRPDVSFLSYERWPKERPRSYTDHGRRPVPDIAVEVISPSDAADEVISKVREYLRGGVRLVWVVYPLVREIHAYWPEKRDVRVYFETDELDAGDILPGFSTPVGALFPPVETPPAAPDDE